jgi:hypothetical protein
MKVAALYDIHGNLPALEAVLTEYEVRGALLSIMLCFSFLAFTPRLQKVLEYPYTVTRNLYTFTGT